MPNWFYYDESGKKFGPYTVKQIQSLVKCEMIKRETILEDEKGKKFKAGNYSSLFPVNWFYYDGTKKLGPYSTDNIRGLIKNGIIKLETILENEKGDKFKAENISSLFSVNENYDSSEKTNDTLMNNDSDSIKIIEKLEETYTIFYRSLIGLIVTQVVSFFLLLILIMGEFQSMSLYVLTLAFSALISFALLIIFIYHSASLFLILWSVIPESIARTKPRKAIGYLFIPYFSFYWSFVAIEGLAEDMNKALEGNKVNYRVNEVRCMIICILNCWLVLLPCAPLILLIIFIFLLNSAIDLKNGAIRFLQSK